MSLKHGENDNIFLEALFISIVISGEKQHGDIQNYIPGQVCGSFYVSGDSLYYRKWNAHGIHKFTMPRFKHMQVMFA